MYNPYTFGFTFLRFQDIFKQHIIRRRFQKVNPKASKGSDRNETGK